MLNKVRRNRLRSRSPSKCSPRFYDFLCTHNLDSNKIVRSGWGSRPNFQRSYGLKVEDYQEGKEILKAMEKADKESEARSKRTKSEPAKEQAKKERVSQHSQ